MHEDHEPTIMDGRPAVTRATRRGPRVSLRSGVFVALAAYATAMPVLASGIGVWLLPEIVAVFEEASTWAAPLFAAAAAVLIALALAPATAVAALAGGLFGMAGLGPALVAYALACVVVFEVARRFFRANVQAAIIRSPRARAAQAELEQATFRIVVLSRLSPMLPFALVSVLLAVSPVTRWTYLGGTLAGMLPRTVGAVAIGAATGRVLTGLDSWRSGTGGDALSLVFPVLAAVATAGLLWYATRAIRRALSVRRAPS